jgi:hypothetical protein
MSDRRAAWTALAATHGRHWWTRIPGNDYVPPVFALLTDDEWALMEEWWTWTGNGPGELNVPGIGVLGGLIEGGGIRRIVELGRYEGYTTLLVGFMLRRMGAPGGLLSFDIDPGATERARHWITRAGLDDYVRIVLCDSRDPASVALAREHFAGDPQLVFLDTSHEREQTLVELPLWYESLAPGGLIVLHDSSIFAAQWDATGQGGVRAGLHEWIASLATPPQWVNLNDDLVAGPGVYADANGLGIIAKPVGR